MEEFIEILKEISEEPDLLRLQSQKQHRNFSRLEHSISVAYYSYCVAQRMNLNINYKELVRGCLLHDYYFYDWHDKNNAPRLHGYVHPKIALDNAKKDVPDLTKKEQNMILSHMWPLTITKIPKSKEAVILCIADKYCATREVLAGILTPKKIITAQKIVRKIV